MARLVLTKEIQEYIRVRYESTQNITHIADEVMKKFNLQTKAETFRRRVGTFLAKSNIKKQTSEIKRLFFDIETSYYLVPTFQFWKVNINPDNILREKKIICIAYKWQYEDKVHVLKWDENQDDTKLIKDFIQVIKDADELIAHNGDKFDIKELRTRAILTGNLMFPIYRTLDTLKKSRQYFRFPSNKLDYLGKVLNVGRKLDHEGMKLWIDICEHKNKASLKKMIEYCITPDHKLLTDDMRWKEAGDIIVGDKVLGFDEYSTLRNRRKFREAIVEKVKRDNAEVYEVKLSSGKIFKVTAEHKWLVKNGNDYKWTSTLELNESTRIAKVMDMWEEKTTKDAGWLSGMFDGEGCLSFKGAIHKDGYRTMSSLSIAQRPTTTLDKIERLLSEHSTLFGKRTTKTNSDCISLNLHGHRYEKLKFLGEIRPERLLEKLSFNNLGSFEAKAGIENVVSVTSIGVMEIIKIQTSTGTFICDGYAHHNCVQDVAVLEDVYFALSPYIYHNTNMAVLKGGEKWHCPECASQNVQLSHTDATAMGYIKRHMKCNSCRKFYKISNRTYIRMLEFTLLKSKDANT